MPPAKLKAYSTMLPRLRAEETLERFNLLVAAEGRSMEDSDQRSYLRELEIQALGHRPRAAKATRSDLAMLGIHVTREDISSSTTSTSPKSRPSKGAEWTATPGPDAKGTGVPQRRPSRG